MEPSSPASKLPEGVSDADLYEGPKVVAMPSGKASFVEPAAVDLVKPIPQPPPQNLQLQGVPGQVDPVPVATEPDQSAYVNAIGLALDILATKTHALLVLIGAIGFWGFAVVDPEPWRLGAAAAYSLMVVIPMLVIYAQHLPDRS